MTDDGFILVKSKRKSSKPKKLSFDIKLAQGCCSPVEEESVLHLIELSKEELQKSVFYFKFTDIVRCSLDKLKFDVIEEIICYGLGNFSECVCARYQLALLLLLQENWLVGKVFAHDPLFSAVECNILKHLKCDIIEKNEEGKHRVVDKKMTLAFFPHCPKQLTNNFLWANWGLNLQNCVIIANSFTKVIENNLKSCLEENASYIQHLFPYTLEYTVENSFRLDNIFNDICVHIFPDLKNPHTQYLWNIVEEPKYSDEDLEFITQSIVPVLKINS